YESTQRYAPPYEEGDVVLGGIPSETLRLTAADGVHVGAWLFTKPRAECAFVVVHGNGASRRHMMAPTEAALDLGCHALAVTVRAHGDSEGDTNDFGYSARLDVAAAVAALKARFPDARRVVFGSSLGAAAALFAAPELGDDVQGYLLESPYESLEVATRNRIAMLAPGALVTPILALLEVWSGAFLSVPMAEVAPARAAARMPDGARVVVLAGGADVHATPDEARHVTEAVPGGATLEVLPGVAHSRLWGPYEAVFRRHMAALAAP
ncbi:MAG: alpha/beta hydrolase, partial [Myxococcales bacterium]|nr:alpha/beta hydrolase [Myxococcales bacterium]